MIIDIRNVHIQNPETDGIRIAEDGTISITGCELKEEGAIRILSQAGE